MRAAIAAAALAGMLGMTFDVSAAPRETEAPNALDAYVAEPDEHYQYKVVAREETDAGLAITVFLTSGAWRRGTEVDSILWTHWMNIRIPAERTSQTALLMITGGNTDMEVQTESRYLGTEQAARLGMTTVEISTVPNQPLHFLGDPEWRPRWEDSTIARSWREFLATGDETWILQLPMTRAAVRAMDAAQAVSEAEGAPIDSFVVTGASKRGWTSWLTAAVDDRVSAVAPIVIDLLNMEESFRHHEKVYGFWAPALDDYVEEKIMDLLEGGGDFSPIGSIVDPFTYRDRLTMPKLILNSASDEFFVSDSTRFYLTQLDGPTYLRNVANTGHSLRGTDALETILQFAHAQGHGVAWPEITPTLDRESGAVSVRTSENPLRVSAWIAHNPAARDFRFSEIDEAWIQDDIRNDGTRRWGLTTREPEEGWMASFIEFEFQDPSDETATLKLTTEVLITPDVYPGEVPIETGTEEDTAKEPPGEGTADAP